MKRAKHKPARPHWERIAARRSNGVNEVITPDVCYRSYYGFGNYATLKRRNRPASAEPGK